MEPLRGGKLAGKIPEDIQAVWDQANIQIANDAYPNSMTEDEKNLINEVKALYDSKIKVNCTICKYCMPCPVGVNIPGSFAHLNNASIFEDVEGTKKQYNIFIKDEQRASKCIECGKCEEVCPQQIPIRDMLKEVVKIFEG